MNLTSTTPFASDAWFVTTHWSVVLSAREAVSPQSAAALETLCLTYWYPLYAYVRRLGHQTAGAQDLTQEFFARFVVATGCFRRGSATVSGNKHRP